MKFRYVLANIWHGRSENMEFIKKTKEKDSIFPLKTNRLVAFSERQHHRRQYVPINLPNLKPGDRVNLYLKGVDFPIQLIKEAFINSMKAKATCI